MRKTLIVVDMQNDFIDGSLGTKEAQAIIPAVKEKIAEYQSNHDEIIFTRDTHFENYLETNEGKNLPVEHCIKGTKGWEIHEQIDIPECTHIDKLSFGYTGWAGRDFECVELVGLCTDICVVSNALLIKALYPSIDVFVDAGCCAGVTVKTHQAALETMKMCQIKIL